MIKNKQKYRYYTHKRNRTLVDQSLIMHTG